MNRRDTLIIVLAFIVHVALCMKTDPKGGEGIVPPPPPPGMTTSLRGGDVAGHAEEGASKHHAEEVHHAEEGASKHHEEEVHDQYIGMVTAHEDNPCPVVFERVKRSINEFSDVTFSPAEEVLCSFNFRGSYQNAEMMLRSYMLDGETKNVMGAFFLNWGHEGNCLMKFFETPSKIEPYMTREEHKTPVSEELKTLIKSALKPYDKAGVVLIKDATCTKISESPIAMRATENEDRSFTIEDPVRAVQELVDRDKSTVSMLVETHGRERNFPSVYVSVKFVDESRTSAEYNIITPCSGINGMLALQLSRDKDTAQIHVDVDGVDSASGCPWSGSSSVKFGVDMLELLISVVERILVVGGVAIENCEMELIDCAQRKCRGNIKDRSIPLSTLSLFKYGKTFYDRAADFRNRPFTKESSVNQIVFAMSLRNMFDIDVVADDVKSKLAAIKVKDSVVVRTGGQSERYPGPAFESVDMEANQMIRAARLSMGSLSGKDYSNEPLRDLLVDLEKCHVVDKHCCDAMSDILELLPIRYNVRERSIENFGNADPDKKYSITGMLSKVFKGRDIVRTCTFKYRDTVAQILDEDWVEDLHLKIEALGTGRR